MKTEIDKFEPCREAMLFRRRYNSFEEAWNACERGDWMLWIASKLKVDKRLLVLAKGKCAETVIHLMEDERSINAVKAAIAFGEGKISEKELENAVDAAAYVVDAAAYAAVDAAAYAAAYTAAYAVDVAIDVDVTAYAAAYAAAYAVDVAVDAAAYAVDVAVDAAADARKENQLKTASICRELLTEAVFEKINNQ